MFKKIKEEVNQKLNEQYMEEGIGEPENNFEEITKILEEDEYQPVGLVVLESLALCGPILWLVWNCIMREWSKLFINVPLAIVAALLLFFTWKNYYKKRKEDRVLQKKKNRGSLLLLLLIIIGIVLMLLLFAALSMIQKCIFAVDGWLFYANSSLSIYLIIILGVVMIVTIISVLLSKISKNSEWNWGIAGFVKKHWKVIVIISMVVFYIAITGVTFVTEDKIVYHSWLHPLGIKYSYEDVSEIKTGYKGGIGSSKGDFYYKARFDGRWISFSETNPNEKVERYNDTYMEIEAFDKQLMKYHPKKQSSHKNEKNANLEQVYIDRFNRIIDNK